ncbi:hypothetical protein AALB19_01660 [Oscillospiraceae bacterium 50-58]
MTATIPSFELETVSLFLSSAIKNFRILREEMESDLLAQKRSGINLGPEHLMDCCDAMGTVLRELDRINEELDAVVDAAYNVKKEG